VINVIQVIKLRHWYIESHKSHKSRYMEDKFLMSKEKSTGIYFKLSPKERELIEDRMKICKINNMSAYIRKMSINGYIINLDLSCLNEIGKLLRISSNNINQLAKQANINGEIVHKDIIIVKDQLHKIRLDFGSALEKLSKI